MLTQLEWRIFQDVKIGNKAALAQKWKQEQITGLQTKWNVHSAIHVLNNYHNNNSHKNWNKIKKKRRNERERSVRWRYIETHLHTQFTSFFFFFCVCFHEKWSELRRTCFFSGERGKSCEQNLHELIVWVREWEYLAGWVRFQRDTKNSAAEFLDSLCFSFSVLLFVLLFYCCVCCSFYVIALLFLHDLHTYHDYFYHLCVVCLYIL